MKIFWDRMESTKSYGVVKLVSNENCETFFCLEIGHTAGIRLHFYKVVMLKELSFILSDMHEAARSLEFATRVRPLSTPCSHSRTIAKEMSTSSLCPGMSIACTAFGGYTYFPSSWSIPRDFSKSLRVVQ